jgi:hypothetical protein
MVDVSEVTLDVGVIPPVKLSGVEGSTYQVARRNGTRSAGNGVSRNLEARKYENQKV